MNVHTRDGVSYMSPWIIKPELFKSVIDCYSRANQAEEAVRWLEKMREFNLDVTIDIYGSILHSYAKSGDSTSAEAWVKLIKEREIPVNTIIYNSLINSYAKSNQPREAERALIRMRDEGIEANNTSWNSVINAFARNGDMRATERLFRQMEEVGLKGDIITFTSLVHAAANRGKIKQATQYIEMMVERNLTPNSVSFNTVLDAFSKRGSREGAEKWLERMKSLNIAPDEVTMKNLINTTARPPRPRTSNPNQPNPAAIIDLSKAADVSASLTLFEKCEKENVPIPDDVYEAIIHMFARRGDINRATDFFNKMKKATTTGCNALIFGYTQVRDTTGARKLYERMLSQNINPNVVTFNSLIANSTDNINAAENWFNLLHEHKIEANRITYNAMVLSCARSGDHHRALHYIETMLSKQIEPNLRTFNSVMLDAFVKQGDAQGASNWLKSLKQKNVALDNTILNAIATVIARATERASILAQSKPKEENVPKVIEDSPKIKQKPKQVKPQEKPQEKKKPSTTSTQDRFKVPAHSPRKWKTLFQDHAKAGDSEACIKLLHQLRRRGMDKIENDKSTLSLSDHSMLLQALAEKGMARECRHWLDEMHDSNIIPDSTCLNAIITAFKTEQSNMTDVDERSYAAGHRVVLRCFARNKQAENAEDWLKSMQAMYEVKPDVNCYTYVIQAYLSNGQLSEATRIFQEMEDNNLKADAKLYISLIHSHSRNNDPVLALEWFDLYHQSGLRVSARAYEAIVYMFCKSGDLDQANQYIELMRKSGIAPTINIYNNLIFGHTQSITESGSVQEIYNQMLEENVTPDVVTFNSLIGNCSKSGDTASAEMWFETMQSSNITPNRITYNSLVSCFASQGDVDLSSRFINLMIEANCLPNLRTFNSVIHSAAVAGDGQKAEDNFNQMKKMGIRPDVISYNSVIDAYATRGDAAQAKKWFRIMKESNISPDEISFSSVIEAHSQQGDPAGAAEWLKFMVASKIQPNMQAAGAVMYGYARQGHMKEARLWYTKMFFRISCYILCFDRCDLLV